VDARRHRGRSQARELQMEELPEVATAQQSPPRIDLDRLLLALPAPQREVLILLNGSEMTVKEVAEATSSTVSAVKQRAHRAYARLRTFLQEHSRDH
jgi:RNA polymerase sigma-70 factor, ECF subfamily